jgi:predicted flap endonuclease-1-like 5' DNA nuclease
MNKVILVTGTIVGVAYLTELFIAWYSGYVYEQFAFFNRAAGPYWWSYFGMMFCNVISPQILWVRKYRRSIGVTFFVSIVINIGMWFERFVIIATTLARDYLPSSWSYYSPTWVEMGIFAGTIGIFFTLYLIFAKVAPVVAIAEVKMILKSSGDQYTGPNAIHHKKHSDHSHGITASSADREDIIRDNLGAGIPPANTGTEDVATSAATPVVTASVESDDLKKIEGIGPKIAEILNNGGIHTFVQLADSDPAFIKTLLEKAGPRYQMHDPGTWPEQAALARDGRWDELDDLQDRLDGGKYV